MTSGICPYCRYEVFSAEGEHTCPLCGAVHHSECWAENGGCAVIGCEATAESPDGAKIVITEVELDIEPSEGSGKPRKFFAPQLSRTMIIAAIFLVALAIAAAFYLRSITQEEELGPEIKWEGNSASQLR